MPKIVDHDERRRALLAGTFDVLSERGYSNVSMRELAAELGVSTGTLYHYLPTKVAILEQLFRWAMELETGELDDQQAGRPSLDAMREVWRKRGQHYRNLLRLALDLRRQLPQESERTLGEFAARYKANVANTLGISERAAHIAWTYLLGAVVHSLLAPQQVSFSDEVSFVYEVLLRLSADQRDPEEVGRLLDAIAREQP